MKQVKKALLIALAGAAFVCGSAMASAAPAQPQAASAPEETSFHISKDENGEAHVKEVHHDKQAASDKKVKKDQKDTTAAKHKRPLKAWEKKYYELHPDEQKDEENNVHYKEKHNYFTKDDDQYDWHRI